MRERKREHFTLNGGGRIEGISAVNLHKVHAVTVSVIWARRCCSSLRRWKERRGPSLNAC